MMNTTWCKSMICVRFRTLKYSDEWFAVVLNGFETSVFLHRRLKLLHSFSSVQVSRARFNRAVSHSETIVVSIAQSSEIVLTLAIVIAFPSIVPRSTFFLVDLSGGLVLCLALCLFGRARGLGFLHLATERRGGDVQGVLGWCEHWHFLKVDDLNTAIEAFLTRIVCSSLINPIVPFRCRLQ